MTSVSHLLLTEVLELALRAPSVRNTQPWGWRIATPTTLELYADTSRQLTGADPDGRDLAISCGAILHHAVTAAECLGLTTRVVLAPPSAPLVATVHVAPGSAPADAAQGLAALAERCTDRRRFTTWPVPDRRLHELAEGASEWGAEVVPLVGRVTRSRVELLMSRARSIRTDDSRHDDEDGVESTEGLLAICTVRDDRTSWVQAGEALSSLWLRAHGSGLSVVPLRQVVAVPETRRAMRAEVFHGRRWPQLLVRTGWQQIGRTTLPRTPRRPLADVVTG